MLPGLGGPNGVAILLPLTFTMDPTSAIVMLSCISWGAPWSVATTFDGYPMAQQGRAAEALTAAFTSSFIGSLAAVLLNTLLAPMISSFALKIQAAGVFCGHNSAEPAICASSAATLQRSAVRLSIRASNGSSSSRPLATPSTTRDSFACRATAPRQPPALGIIKP